MKKNVFILVLVMIGMMVIIILGCNSRGINFWGNSSIGGGFVPAIGKVSNTFGTPLSRDIDGDTDNDSAVVLNNIAGGSGFDFGYSVAIDGSGKVYVTGSSINSSGNSDAYVIRLDNNGNMDSSFGSGGKVILNDIAGVNVNDIGYSLSIDGSGKVYVTGYSFNGTNWDAYVIKIE